MDEQHEDGRGGERDVKTGDVISAEATVGSNRQANRGVGSGDDPSSSSSSNGRGSGGGYSADCSSSDSSSETSSNKKRNPNVDISTRVKNLALEEGAPKSARNVAVVTNGPQLGQPKSQSHHASTSNRKTPSASLFSIAEGSAGHVSTQLNVLNDMIQQGKDLAITPLVPLGQTLPQWNGVRVSNPMDPRIDLSAVNHVNGSSLPAGTTMAASGVHAAMSGGPPLSVDNYLHLMQAVSPFFTSYGALSRSPVAPVSNAGPTRGRAPNEAADAASESQQLSSEGFTSFFTTTSDSNSGKDNGNQGESAPSGSVARRSDLKPPPGGSPEDESDSSSMVVLARVKRKHLARQQQGTDSIGSTSSGSGEARMNPAPPEQPAHGPAQGNGQDQNGQQQHEGSGLSSASSERPPQIRPQAAAHIGNMSPNQPRIVSESSDAARARAGSSMTSSNATNSATTTSGSGSGGNSGSGTGSGSNNGSSGSGDNQGSSGSGGEGKNSSGGENGSKEGVSWEKNSPDGAPLQPPPIESRNEGHASVAKMVSVGQVDMNADNGAAREQKLMDKKRKRMNMRREYEEQIHNQQASSESSHSTREVWLRPGKPVTLESVLSFTKIARLVTQGSPPFLVVHANGAFTALTGIDSHAALGRPIGEILSIPDPNAAISSGQFNIASDLGMNGEESLPSSKIGSTSSGPNLAAAAAAGQARAHSGEQIQLDMNVERLVAASGFGRLHFVNVVAQSHQMVGKNVTFVRDGPPAADAKGAVAAASASNGRSGDEHGSNGSSLPSSDSPFLTIPCRMGVCPVASAPGVGDIIAKPPGVEETSTTKECVGVNHHHHHHHHKRRKHHGQYHAHSHSRSCKTTVGGGSVPRTNLITHFVVQLERVYAQNDSSSKRPSHESLSSRSHEREKTVRTPQQERRRPEDEEPEEETMDDATESTDPKEAVTAIG